jgi:serine phosphatase RsbU (regulator of sigma subunit)
MQSVCLLSLTRNNIFVIGSKTIGMKHLFTCIVLSTFLCSQAISQSFRPHITNFTTREYGKQQTAQNWAITQDHRGVMYFGNANAVMEYDGQSWNTIKVKSGSYIISLATDSMGTIFVGANGEFGYLEPNKRGTLIYHSLSDSTTGLLTKPDLPTSNVHKIYASANEVYFQTEEFVYVYDYKTIKVLRPRTSFHLSFFANNTFYVRQRETGILKYENGGLSLIEDGHLFADIGVFSMVPYKGNSGQTLVATYENGLWIYDANKSKGAVTALTDNPFHLAYSSQIYGGIALSDGKYALNTLSSGVLIINDSARVEHVIDKETGIRVNDTKAVFQDKDGNLWCALNNGISKIDYSSPLSFYSEKAGISGNVETVIRHQNKLYVGTSNGLYSENSDFLWEGEGKEFSRHEYIETQVWELTSLPDALLVGTGNGVYMIPSNSSFDEIPRGDNTKIAMVKLLDRNASVMHYFEQLNLLVVGGIHGIYFLQKQGNKWNIIDQFEGYYGEIVSMVNNPATPAGKFELWMGTLSNGMLRISFEEDFFFSVERYTGDDGANLDWNAPFVLDNQVIVGTSTGLLSFVDEETVRNAVADSLKEFARGYFDIAQLYNEDINVPVYAIKDYNKKTWASIDNKVMEYDKAEGKWSTLPFMGIDMGRINSFYQEENGTCWISTDDGLISCQPQDLKNYTPIYHTLIRRVSFDNYISIFEQIRKVLFDQDHAVFQGTFSGKGKGSFNGISLTQPGTAKREMEYNDNSVTIQFAAPFYEQESQLQYSYKLKGYDDKWSEWSPIAKVDYTNLDEGSYQLEVKAKNIYGHESEKASYAFTILPPWYRTLWAYVAYVVIFLIVVFVIVRLSLMRLKAQNVRLELIVEERTAEIADKNKVLEGQNIEIRHQKEEITDSINYAVRLQRAIFPTEEQVKSVLPDSFILFKPKDIVSGDFYWLDMKGDKVLFTAADCTGHGVPGAFVSIVGHNALNRAVNEFKLTQPAAILDKLVEIVEETFSKSGEEVRDGMDMALCCYDIKNKTLEYAGANNPLYLVRNGELQEIKADKQPIGKYDARKPYTNHTFQLEEGDCYFIFSDGYADQFGGPRGKKFKYKPFKELLLQQSQQPMEELNKVLDDAFESWKEGDDPTEEFEQIDDVCVIGVRYGS